MSKYTKIIATLGVAAGLGVASLPLGAFAAKQDYTGTVDITATVPDAITVSIKNGTDDAFVFNDKNATPSTENVFTKHFEDEAGINFGDITAGTGKVADEATVISVSTNVPNGFYATIKTSGALKNSAGTGANYEIAPFSSDGDDVEIKDTVTSADTEGWGVRITKKVNSVATDLTTPAFTPAGEKYYHGVSTTTAAKFDDIDEVASESTYEYTVKYGINIKSGKAAGTYKGDVTYVVTSDPDDRS